MLTPTVTIEQGKLICDLNDLGGLDSLQTAVKNKTLARFQTQSLAFAAVVEKCLISLDTGLGKTLVATGLMNVLSAMPENIGMKWIVIVQNSNLVSTYNKIKDGLYNLEICYSDSINAKVVQMFTMENMNEYDVFVLSYEAIVNETMNDFLFNMRNVFNGIIVDESHTISNMTATGSKIIQYIMKCMKYRYMLTATPIRVNPNQIINQIYSLDEDMFSDVRLDQYKRQFELKDTTGKVVSYKDLDYLREDIFWRYIGATRADLGAKGDHTVRVILPEPKEEYLDVKKMDTFRDIKGDYGGPAMVALLQLVLDKKARGEIGVAYVNQNVTKQNVKRFLEEAGVSVGVLDGTFTNTNEKKEEVHQAFSKGEYDILLTNITTGRDLQCNYLMFYEMTFDFQQFLGRGERGLTGNDMDVIFILVKDTEEITYFYENMLQRAEMLELIGKKDVEELKNAYEQISRNGSGGCRGESSNGRDGFTIDSADIPTYYKKAPIQLGQDKHTLEATNSPQMTRSFDKSAIKAGVAGETVNNHTKGESRRGTLSFSNQPSESLLADDGDSETELNFNVLESKPTVLSKGKFTSRVERNAREKQMHKPVQNQMQPQKSSKGHSGMPKHITLEDLLN